LEAGSQKAEAKAEAKTKKWTVEVSVAAEGRKHEAANGRSRTCNPSERRLAGRALNFEPGTLNPGVR